MEIVRSHHPISKQAALQIETGNETLRSTRGAFDPKIFTDIGEKYFDEGQYYSLVDAGLKIPTWLGIEIQAGYEQNKGAYLNPENNTPEAGLVYAGISLPVGQGLFIDKRRAELQKAKRFQQITALEQQIMLNELLYESGKAYWDWFIAHSKLQVFEEAVELAEERFEAVKRGAYLGDLPAIDTLEAGIQLQNRELSLQEAQLEFQNATELLSLYLWVDGMIPLETSEGTIPISRDSITDFSVNGGLLAQLDTFISNHPELQQYRYKIEQMEIDKRWKREQLKPVVNLKYNALSEPVNGNPFAMYSTNNYTWGLEFSFPIFLRKERGNFKLADIKIRDAQLDIATKQASIEMKTNIALNQWSTTIDQIDLYNQTVKDYNGLLSGEQKMFDAGESSLFMVNSREVGYIQAQLKLIDLIAKNQKASLSTSYSLGILSQ
jgi:outer membrane protein TolC